MKIHLLYSFLAHTILLSYLLSLPIYSDSANLKPFEGYVVYPGNEEEKTVGKPLSPYKVKKSAAGNQGKAKDEKVVLKTKEVNVKEDVKRLEAEKIIIPEMESSVKKEEAAEEKAAKAVEVEKKPLEPPKAEKALKEKIAELKEKEILVTKKEVHETKEPEVKKETVKVFPPTEGTKEAMKPIPPPALPQRDTGVFPGAISENKAVSSKEGFKEKTMPAEKVEKKVVVTERESEHEIEEVREEKAVRTVEVKEPPQEMPPRKMVRMKEKVVRAVGVKKSLKTSGDKKALKGKASAAVKGKKIKVAKRVLHKGGVIAEILTPESNRMPSQEEYSLKLGGGGEQMVAEVKPEVKEGNKFEEKKPPSVIPVSDILFLKDINIGVFLYPDFQRKKELAPATTELITLPGATEITGILLEESADIVKVQIKGNGSMTPSVFPLDNNRIVVDIPGVVMSAPIPSVLVSPLKNIRTGKYEGKTRLVLDLKEELNFDVSLNGASIVVVIQKTGKKYPLSPMPQKPEGKIETAEIKDTGVSDISLCLLKKAHPMANNKDALEKQREVNIVAEKKGEKHIKDTLGIKMLLSVAKAEKGIYTFVVNNKGERSYKADVVFRIYEGKAGEKIKKFKTVELPLNTVLQFKFILPEAVFWDDEDYFTGTIEGSNTMTKFNDKTGLIWKEGKDY